MKRLTTMVHSANEPSLVQKLLQMNRRWEAILERRAKQPLRLESSLPRKGSSKLTVASNGA